MVTAAVCEPPTGASVAAAAAAVIVLVWLQQLRPMLRCCKPLQARSDRRWRPSSRGVAARTWLSARVVVLRGRRLDPVSRRLYLRRPAEQRYQLRLARTGVAAVAAFERHGNAVHSRPIPAIGAQVLGLI